ncbi:SWI/SNF-related matrix-associated actin-dependent regulator of chromatin subfamily A-like protein 1 [Coccinella septempunctata]|uniref:SWI/SNF-related matrix-associated actin-dependent regulator of chromatin subfamily A-like protein 1 n=1 Tax=Coccinella septempunctata TaxID=41139 RepID=UPI001D080E1D|nr:SWI/SNF-related matrix-associated actin-dependent regulator of chromatin subfamily A-like protein 1 [Coccinella septempunctata]
MQCTPAEIERKRLEALKKLASKNKSPLKPQNSSNGHVSQSPKFKFSKSFPSTSSTNHYAKPYDRTNAVNKPITQFNPKDSVVTAKCVLQNESRFVVKLSAFSSPAIEVFKTIPSRNYDTKERLWSFHIKDHDGLITKLSGLNGHLEVLGLPRFVLNCVRSTKTDLSTIDLSPIEPELRNTLMPFQREGVAFGIDKGGRCLIADDMGLGKTIQALGIASYYRKDWPLLIVTTASMKNTWEQTIVQYFPSLPLRQLQYMVTTKDYINEAHVLIVSHDMLSRSVNKLVEKRFGVVIVDESHIFKNFKTKGTQAALTLVKIAKRVILLSGTPALSRPSELYTQLSFIDSRFFVNFMEYSKRYCDGKTTHYGWDASGQSNLSELEIVLAHKFMIRRTKDQVLQSLPNKNQEIILLDVKLNQLSKEDRNCLVGLALKFNSKKGTDKHSALLAFFSETARIKIPSVLSYILQVLEENKKFLVFAHHQIMLDAITQILTKKGKKFIRIDGSTAPLQRKNYVDQFQTVDECVCAVLSITAANAGITLTSAELVIFAELHWNPSILSQAESRAHRIGQDKPVTIRYLLAPGTADDSIWPMIQKKQKILTEAGLFKDSFNDVEMKNQQTSSESTLTEGIENTTILNTLDISSYFISPSKKQKINDSVVSDLNESLLEDCPELNRNLNSSVSEVNSNRGNICDNAPKSVVNIDDMFNDGFDDILSCIDI